MWLWSLIGLSIITKVHGYSSGDFTESCESMLPNHPRRGVNIPPQSGAPPFYIEVEEVVHGQPLTVSLKSNAAGFKGFMLEAREKNMVGKSCRVGKFILLDSSQTKFLLCTLTGCQRSEAVTQTTNSVKDVIKVNWTAQGEEVDTITFRATFLQSYSKFWKPVEKNVSLPLTTTSPPPPTTTTTTTTQSSTTTSTTVPSTTNPSSTTSTTVTSTKNPRSTTPTPRKHPDDPTVLLIVVQLMDIDLFIDRVKQESDIIYKATRTDNHFSRCGIKALNILCCVLCTAIKISVLFLLREDDYIGVTLTALVCVALVISIIDLVINCLPIEASHELKDIFDYADQVCSVIHMVFSFAAVFVGVLKIEDLRKKRKDSWLVKVMIAYTVLIFLSANRTNVFNCYENAILGTNKTGASKRSGRKKNAGQVCVIAVSVILFVGTLCFTVAVIVGEWEKQEK